MARPKTPTIPEDQVHYFREQLYRELSHMFQWTGLPDTVPADYMERNLVRYGYVMYYEDEKIGQDILRASVQGFNRHGLPVQARTYNINTNQEVLPQVTRNVKRLADSKDVLDQFDPLKDCVLIMNMDWGQNCSLIVEHFAKRLALVNQAIDTNLLWANIPYIFQTSTDDTRLSIEKMFSSVFNGEPFIITDKSLFTDNKDRTGLPTDIPFIGKDLLDVYNEIMMKFRETVGFTTSGVDKAERVNTLEVTSNQQHTQTVAQIMLQQRQIACDAINKFFNQNISVDMLAFESALATPDPSEGGEQNGTVNGGTPNTN